MTNSGFDTQWFIENGCELVEPSIATFYFVYRESNGKPCTDCSCKDTCPAWSKIQTLTNIGRILLKETATHETRQLCPQCHSPLNMTKVARRGGKCACGNLI